MTMRTHLLAHVLLVLWLVSQPVWAGPDPSERLLSQTECSLCRRTDPPHQLTSLHYTEAKNVTHLVCGFCQKDKPNCDICGSPTSAKTARDGRHICPDCQKVAISTPAQLDQLYAEVRNFVTKLTGKPVKDFPPVQLVEKDEMATRWVESSGRSFAAHAFYSPYNPEIIYVLSGHSASDLGPTLAHEFTHAWQSRHCPSQDRQLTEGFATWIEYKYAVSKGYQWKVNQILSKRDHDYGEGLKHCLAIEKKDGVPGLIKFVTTEARFPTKK